jgi:uncharacterized protein
VHLAFPFSVDAAGFVSEATAAEHVEQMIEQILFTRPGERVNLPEFGCGVQALVFGPVSQELATALRARIEAALQRWLHPYVQIQTVEVASQGGRLTILVGFALTPTGERRSRTYVL